MSIAITAALVTALVALLCASPSQKAIDWRHRLYHRLRGHGRPRYQGANQFTQNYQCPCGDYLWKTRY